MTSTTIQLETNYGQPTADPFAIMLIFIVVMLFVVPFCLRLGWRLGCMMTRKNPTRQDRKATR